MSTDKQLNPKDLNKFQHFFYDYGRYHNNHTNILIHIIFVPIIATTMFYLFRCLSSRLSGRDFNDFNYSTLFPIFIFIYYTYVDSKLGFFTGLQYLLLDHLISKVSFGFSGISDFQIILFIHIFGWISQFIGHGVYEGRKPALMDNLLLTLNAPIFVNIEILYYTVGYKNEEINETKKYIIQDIKNYRSKRNN